jgi:hypothetical protein
MSNTEDMKGTAVKSYQGFEEGTYAARKGRLCFIKKIHFEMHPPSVTVQMMDTDTEVGTEFDRLQHLNSWFCDMCSAENSDVQANKCFFCQMSRSYKEKITVVDPAQTAQKHASSQAPPSDKPVEHEQDEQAQSNQEETSDEASEESKPTDDEYEELADPEHEDEEASPNDHELSAEEEQHAAPHAPVHPMHGAQQQRHGHRGPPYPHETHPNQPHPHRHRSVPAHGQSAQNRTRAHTEFMPPPPGSHRVRAPNAPNKRRMSNRTRSQRQPRSFWMDDEDAMLFRRPLRSYWPRSWWDDW